jgi:hypothetical protein
MKTFDAVVITDTATTLAWARGYGAHRIATHLRNHGYSTLVIDFASALTFNLWKEICGLIIGNNTKIVAFSSTWWPYRQPFSNNTEFNNCNIEWASEIENTLDINKDSLTYSAATGKSAKWIDIIKKINKNVKILLGGPKIDWYLDFPADHFIVGLGENQIIDFLSNLEKDWNKIINYDIHSDSRQWGWNTSSTSYTYYDQIKSNEILNLEIARGCKFRCNFCSFPLIGRKDVARYTKTEQTIYNELLENYEKWGTTRYFIADDTFNDSIEKLTMMARIKQKLPFDLKTKAYIRADIIATQPQQIQLLKEGGLTSCYVGIESFHPDASKFAGKGMDPNKRKQALYDMNACWGNDVSIEAGYIVGLPGEDRNFLEEQANWFIQKDCPVNYSAGFIALFINSVKNESYTSQSDIDKNPEKYGYTIPNENKPHYWEKKDNTSINSYSQAVEIANELNEYIWKEKSLLVDNIDYKYATDKTKVITDPVLEYFLPLITKLKN